MYVYPEKKRCETVELKVVGKAMVHGIEGVEIVAVERRDMEFDAFGPEKGSLMGASGLYVSSGC